MTIDFSAYPAYRATAGRLDEILANTADEVRAKKQTRPLEVVMDGARAAEPPRDFRTALVADASTVALIAEVKKASPSRGVLMEDFDPVELATTYDEHGAAAISVLTDETFFQGHLDYLTAVKATVSVPVLRKDFIIDPYQVYEARGAGADAVLLIVAALEPAHLADLHALITEELGMTALVEVHNQAELEQALAVDPALLGINNRDLRSFETDIETTAHLLDLVPEGITTVAESGLLSADDVRYMGDLGADAVLVGEAMARADSVADTVAAFSSQRRAQR